jgi:Mrp family chromosome partitioning ATPase
MSALDRALIKAYRAELHEFAPRHPEPTPLRLVASDDPNSEGARLSIHSAEPLLAGPHFRSRRKRETESTSPPAVVPRSETLATDAANAVMFRVDVGIEGMPAPPMLLGPAPVHASANQAAAVQQPPRTISHAPAPAEPPLRVRVMAPAAAHTTTEPAEVHLTSRPLSSFSSDAASPDESQPQLVVDRFAWPDVCEDLRNDLRPVFDQFLNVFLSAPTQRKAVAMVGIDFGAGCTTTTLCLAQHLAARGLRPAIVDADFARPGVADQLSVKVSHGWNTAISGAMPLGDVLIESLEDRIVLAPLEDSLVERPTIENNLRSTLFWRMLREPHDVMIVDAGTVDDESSQAALRSLCDAAGLDGVYAVCDARSTSPQQLVVFARRLKSQGINLLGIIENFVSN